MSSDKQPFVSSELIQWLEKKFPDRCPAPNFTDREIWMAVGAQSVIKKLRHMSNEVSELSGGE